MCEKQNLVLLKWRRQRKGYLGEYRVYSLGKPHEWNLFSPWYPFLSFSVSLTSTIPDFIYLDDKNVEAIIKSMDSEYDQKVAWSLLAANHTRLEIYKLRMKPDRAVKGLSAELK